MNPIGRVAVKFTRKSQRWVGADRWGPPHQLKKSIFLGKNSHFFGFFLFQLCRVSALGKGFAECPTKDTRQRRLCRRVICRVFFAECSTRQSLCRVQIGLCRVPLTLGKATESGSALSLRMLLAKRLSVILLFRGKLGF